MQFINKLIAFEIRKFNRNNEKAKRHGLPAFCRQNEINDSNKEWEKKKKKDPFEKGSPAGSRPDSR